MRLAADLPALAVPLGGGLSGRVVTSLRELLRLGLRDAPDGAVWGSPGWWQFVEDDPDHEVAYLLVEDARGPLAVAPAIVARGAHELLFYNPPRIVGDLSAIGSPRTLTPDEQVTLAELLPAVEAFRARLYPSLAVGTFGSYFGLRGLAAAAPADDARLLPAVARLAAELARRWQCPSFALLYLDPAEDERLRAGADALGLRRALFGAEGILAVPAGGFDDYLRGLPTSRRNTVRREVRDYVQAGLTSRVDAGAAGLTDAYVPLRAALRAKYGHGAAADWVGTEFAALRRNLGGELVVFSARDAQDRIAGFMLAFRRGDVLYTRAAGFDYALSAGAFCYFNLVYYDTIRWAQRNGIRRIHYGLGTSRAKRARGCVLRPRWAYFGLPPDAPAELAQVLALQDASAQRVLTELGVSSA